MMFYYYSKEHTLSNLRLLADTATAISFAIFFTGSLANSACCQSPPTKTEGTRVSCQFPTAIGTKWEYKKGQAKIEFVVIKAELKGEDKYITLSQSSTLDPIDFSIIRVSKDGIFCTGSTRNANEHLLLSFDLKRPLKWDYDINGSKIGLYQSGVRSYDDTEQISLPMGKFKAHKVTSSISVYNGALQFVSPLLSHYWYVDGIGLVKCTDEDGETIELASFTPQK